MAVVINIVVLSTVAGFISVVLLTDQPGEPVAHTTSGVLVIVNGPSIVRVLLLVLVISFPQPQHNFYSIVL